MTPSLDGRNLRAIKRDFEYEIEPRLRALAVVPGDPLSLASRYLKLLIESCEESLYKKE